ncbi:flagellar biosynthetic protein FliO [Azoarcus sp. DD4]|nr:flagellar biosynthetic protein FliO [Azoarcus sp. DD4]
MLFGLAVVIALLLGCLWLLKRLAAPRGAASALKVLGAAPVGPRERVVLVEVGSEVLVLGVAPGNVRTLHIIPAASLPADAAAGGAPSILAGKDFSAWLKHSLERRKDAP